MLAGFNHNANYKGLTFHVQTEDGGEKNPIITTHLFYQGNVITMTRVDYRSVPQGETFQNTVREMMQEQHKGVLRALIRGEFDNLDSMKTILPKKGETKNEALLKSNVYKIYNPSNSEEKLDIEEDNQEKSLDEMILEYLNEKKEN